MTLHVVDMLGHHRSRALGVVVCDRGEDFLVRGDHLPGARFVSARLVHDLLIVSE